MTEEAEWLFERARSLPPEARAAFLEESYRGDPRLRVEIASLLKHADAAEAFFERLGAAVFSPSALGGDQTRDGHEH